MANSVIVKENPARTLLSTVIYMAKRRSSKVDMLAKVDEYGDYLKVMECDKRLIADAIKEFPRTALAAELSEMWEWFWKMDRIDAERAAA